ncbi:MAG: hypothetical protein B5766_12405 [Candidatus Lumbricidophila eiseniae]|uniref:Methylenetetrahydrofolate reductase n=1 Tax=Candidatus Lumbricidiphila eiseniae TaxID=1969409 RepID=A0A2A6FNJ2_9MICO|nr:MAG: hypothetical protein B5766_12405 [Candidatus Lumbricidophila eiseniae]
MSESGSTPTTSPTTRAHPHPVKISFELFPPRTDAAALALGRTIDRLSDTDPDFISVTFGAGGTSRERSLTVLRYILEHTRIDPMAHLTCVGSSRAEATELVQQFLDAGIRSFLALRGDPPAEHPNGFSLGDLASAAELVHLIRTTHGGELDRLAVAAFPTGHAKSRTVQQDIETLLVKQSAGATLAITQLFWRADDYHGFVAQAREAGVRIPILPGVMPVTSAARLARLAELTGVEPPVELARTLESEPDASRQTEYGVAFSTELVRDVLAGGAPGIHLYTFNRHEAVLDVITRLGLRAGSLASVT